MNIVEKHNHFKMFIIKNINFEQLQYYLFRTKFQRFFSFTNNKMKNNFLLTEK